MVRYVRQRIKTFWAALTLLSVEVIIILVAFVVALSVFLFLVRMIFLQNKQGFDQSAFSFMSGMVSNISTDVMEFFSLLGTHYFLIPANITLILYFLFIQKHRWYSIRIPAIALSGMCMMFLLKSFFKRPRPLMPLLEAARGLSFPSGHATMSSTFYGLLIFMIYRNPRIGNLLKGSLISLLVLFIIMIGASRVYLRVHYASDVLAGFCFGFLWLVLSLYILRRIEIYSRRKVNPIVQNSAT